MDAVAFELAALTAWPTKAAWDAAAAGLVASALDRWHLTPGEAYVGGESGAVLRVTTADGEPAVLKVAFPHVEAVGEAIALEAWGASLAPRVRRQEPWTWWMLLDRVEPGTPLSRTALAADAALEVGATLLGELAATPPPPELPTLREIVSGFLQSALARGARRAAQLGSADRLVERGLAEAEALLADDRPQSLLHGDYNPGNILHAEGGTWRAIDPKPMRGELEFDLWPLVVQVGDPLARERPEGRLETQLTRVAGIVGADVHRAARWGFARTALDVTWAVEDGRSPAAALAALAAWQRVSGPPS